MFGLGKRSGADPEKAEASPTEESTKSSFFSRLKAGLGRTRSGLTDGLGSLLLGKKEIDDELLDEIETRLLTSDVGISATTAIISELSQRLKRKDLADADVLYHSLKEVLLEQLTICDKPLEIPSDFNKPFVILMVGVNGVGKTTTIGKLAKRFQSEGRSVMLAAGDTFRAAAVEQLEVWGSATMFLLWLNIQELIVPR